MNNYKFYFKSLNLLFIDTPKCACTSTKHVLLKNEYNLDINDNFPVSYSKIMQRFPDVIIKDKNVISSMDTIAIIRSPYTRLISGYKNKHLIHTKSNDTFKEFILRLEELLNSKENIIINNHYRPCTYFYQGIQKIKIFHMEEMKELIDYLQIKGVRKDLIDNFPRKNSSEILNENYHFDQEMLDIINNIFEDDFKLGNYDIKTDPFNIEA